MENEIKNIIKKRLKKENISIREISSLLENKEKTIRNYLSGNSKLPIEFIKKIMNNLKFNSKETSKLKKYLKNKDMKKEKYFDEIDLVLLKTLVKENLNIKKELEEKNERLKIYQNKNAQSNQFTYNENLKINAFKNDFNTTTKIIPLLWKLRDESVKIFSELELLLEINSDSENKKMTRGLTKVGNDLIEMGEKIKKYTLKNEILDLGE